MLRLFEFKKGYFCLKIDESGTQKFFKSLSNEDYDLLESEFDNLDEVEPMQRGWKLKYYSICDNQNEE